MTNIEMISLDETAALISDDGTRAEILCCERPVIASEFFKASQQGICNLHLLIVNSDEYGNQLRVDFGGCLYCVYRVYRRTDGYTELHINERPGVMFDDSAGF